MPRWNYRDAFDAEYKAFRARTGWTVDQVAEALGKSVNMLNGYRREHGSIPPDDVIYRAAELFGCEPTRFMYGPAKWNSIRGSIMGWQVSFEVNAKNSYGAYVGYQRREVMIMPDGSYRWRNTPPITY